jgi:hypothetical protein
MSICKHILNFCSSVLYQINDDDDNDTSDGKMIERRCDMMPGNKI